MKKLLRQYLAVLARILIKQKKPFVIGVTGTAGKTTVTSFVVQFLQQEFGEDAVEFSRYHYNGEFGLPLTIIGAKTGGKNLLKWVWVFYIFVKKLFQKYPKFLVLEYGIDTPNEMDFLLSITVPNVSILTPVLPNHIEQFGDEEAYRNEKLKILAAEKNFIHASLFPFVKDSEKNIFYGKNDENSNIFVNFVKNTIDGIVGEIDFWWEKIHIQTPVFGEYQMDNILPIFLLAETLNVPAKNVVKSAKKFHTEAGRCGIFHGKNNAIIIDGSYNGGLLAMVEGIKSVQKMAENWKIILFLGDMRELGNLEKSAHETLAHEIENIFEDKNAVEIFLVGSVMRSIMKPILEKNFAVTSELSSRIAGQKIAEKIQNSSQKSIIFVKWSQNTIFLEEGIKAFLDEKFHKNLCRQSTEWLTKKEKFFKTVEKNPKNPS